MSEDTSPSDDGLDNTSQRPQEAKGQGLAGGNPPGKTDSNGGQCLPGEVPGPVGVAGSLGPSAAKLKANRRNARLSTGPASERGRLAVRFNASKHNLNARSPVIPGESAREYREHCARFYDFYSPEGPVEEHYVQEIADGIWRLRRVRRYETVEVSTTIRAEQKNLRDLRNLSPVEFETTTAGITELLQLLDAAECGVKQARKLLPQLRERLEDYCGHSPYFSVVLDREDPSSEEVLEAIGRYQEYLRERYKEVEGRERQASKLIKALHSIPSESVLNRLQRHETGIRRQLDRDVQNLARVQLQRQKGGGHSE